MTTWLFVALSSPSTLVLVPVVFSLWMDARASLLSRFRRQPTLPEPVEADLELLEEREEVGN